MSQLANLICIIRTIMAIVLAIIVLNNSENYSLLVWSFWFTWLILILDGVDGIVARITKSDNDFGAFFDIACDRVVEQIYVALFVTLNWIPFWVLVVFIVRGILVDGIRGFANKEGKTAFGKNSMMQTKLGHFLTSSRFMRFAYGGIKGFAFAFMFFTKSICPEYYSFEMFLIYLATFFCIVRGIPVLIEGKRFFNT